MLVSETIIFVFLSWFSLQQKQSSQHDKIKSLKPLPYFAVQLTLNGSVTILNYFPFFCFIFFFLFCLLHIFKIIMFYVVVVVLLSMYFYTKKSWGLEEIRCKDKELHINAGRYNNAAQLLCNMNKAQWLWMWLWL